MYLFTFGLYKNLMILNIGGKKDEEPFDMLRDNTDKITVSYDIGETLIVWCIQYLVDNMLCRFFCEDKKVFMFI